MAKIEGSHQYLSLGPLLYLLENLPWLEFKKQNEVLLVGISLYLFILQVGQKSLYIFHAYVHIF